MVSYNNQPGSLQGQCSLLYHVDRCSYDAPVSPIMWPVSNTLDQVPDDRFPFGQGEEASRNKPAPRNLENPSHQPRNLGRPLLKTEAEGRRGRWKYAQWSIDMLSAAHMGKPLALPRLPVLYVRSTDNLPNTCSDQTL